MCSSKAKVTVGIESSTTLSHHVARINGRPVLQPTCNHVVPNLERRNSIKKLTPKSLSPLPLPIPNKTTTTSLIPPISPKPKSPTRPLAIKRGNNNNNGMNLSCEKLVIPKNRMKTPSLERKKSKSLKEGSFGIETSLSYSSSLITDSPGSIAAGRREQMALHQAQRKMKIAHYGRSKSAKFERVFPIDSSNVLDSKTSIEEEKRCSFITANSGKDFHVYNCSFIE
ncbi:putative GMP synthase [glutamine-hydrolyzing] [Trifolium repens]|nr:putative GMP synthase [glutamine-hydrolyzing] [Trifolium repens]